MVMHRKGNKALRLLPLRGLAAVLLALALIGGAASANDFAQSQWVRNQAKQRGITLIAPEQAQAIAVKALGGKSVSLKEIDLDNEADDYPNGTDFRPVYQMEFRSGAAEYDVDVDAVSGEVLKVKRDD